MKNIFIFLFIAMMGSATVTAQDKIKFSSITQAGFVSGTSASAFTVYTVAGVRLKGWSAGAGGGYDAYYFHSIPLFLELRKNLLNKPNTPFVMVDAGVNLPSKKKIVENQWTDLIYHKGYYGNFGFGYQVPVNRRLQLNVMLAFSRKVMHEDKVYYYSIHNVPPVEREESFRENFTYYFNRVSFTTGLSF